MQSNTQATNPIAEHKLENTLRYLLVNITCTYLLGAIFYADPFHFWEHALSELGTTVTLLGSPNLAAALIVTMGMFINGRLMLEIARIFRLQYHRQNAKLKSTLMYTASMGSFISIFPNNLFHGIHSIGSAFCIGSIFLFDLTLLLENLKTHPSLLVKFEFGVLCLGVLSYAVTYFLDFPIKQALQKICVINLLLVLFLRSMQTMPARIHSTNHPST